MTFNATDFLAGLFGGMAAPAATTPTAADPHDLQSEPINATPDAELRWDDLQDVTSVPTCPTCHRLLTWQDGSGRWRCRMCDFPHRSRRLMERAERRRLVAIIQTVAAAVVVDVPGSDLGAPYRRLVGAEYSKRSSPQPDPAIIAAPVTICPRCRSARLLVEMQNVTGGLCWTCWTAGETIG